MKDYLFIELRPYSDIVFILMCDGEQEARDYCVNHTSSGFIMALTLEQSMRLREIGVQVIPVQKRADAAEKERDYAEQRAAALGDSLNAEAKAHQETLAKLADAEQALKGHRVLDETYALQAAEQERDKWRKSAFTVEQEKRRERQRADAAEELLRIAAAALTVAKKQMFDSVERAWEDDECMSGDVVWGDSPDGFVKFASHIEKHGTPDWLADSSGYAKTYNAYHQVCVALAHLDGTPPPPPAPGPYQVDNLDRKCVVVDFGSYHVLICRCRDEKAAELITQALNAQYDAERIAAALNAQEDK